MSTILVGNAPCSWGSLEFEGLEGEAIRYPQMLDELAATGYTGTELGDWGYMPTDPALLAAALLTRGLTLTGAFVPVALADASTHEAGIANAVRTATLLAEVQRRTESAVAPRIVLADNNGTVAARTQRAGRVTPDLALDDASWSTFAAGAEAVAAAVREQAGLQTVFHHHCAGYVETPDEIATLLRKTSPELLGLVFDTGHLAFGAGEAGCDAVTEVLDRFGDRTAYVHFKDFDPAVAAQARAEGWDYFAALRHGVFCELGQGCVDFPAVVAWMQQRGYSGFVTVEQDVLPGMGAPRESARRNREYLERIGLPRG
jgi:inosose dehydratase